jgi:hypothetical protein
MWTGACGLYFWHIIAAFHFAHDWNHAAAREHRADKDKRMRLLGHGIEPKRQNNA